MFIPPTSFKRAVRVSCTWLTSISATFAQSRDGASIVEVSNGLLGSRLGDEAASTE
jgi:hypothetical protein